MSTPPLPLKSLLLLACGQEGLVGSESSRQVELRWNALDTVSGIQVLDKRDLIASGSTLAGGDGGVRKEVLPDLLKVRYFPHDVTQNIP
jgi:hypothetical protein